MSDNPNPNAIKNGEIDILDLFRRMGRSISKLFNSMGRGILISVVFLFKNWMYIALSLILGVAASYLLKINFKRLYVSEMVIACYGAPSSEVTDYINKLHFLSRQNNTFMIAKYLNIDEEKAGTISDIQTFWIIDKGNDGIPDYIDYNDSHDVHDTVDVRMPNRFAVRVKITSPLILPEIRDGIFSYVEHNKFFVEQNNLRLIQLGELLNRLNYDIVQLDSLQKIKYFQETKNRVADKGAQMIFLQDQKTQLIFDEIYTLYDKKQKFDSRKTLFPGIITLLSDFTIPSVAVNGAIYYGKYLIPTFFITCIIILVIVQNRKKLMDVYRKY